MNKNIQQGPAGPVITWARGLPFEAKIQFDNSVPVQVAMAQGVKTSGYLAVKTDRNGKPVVPIDINTYIEFPKLGVYARVADAGVVEAGADAPFQERQFSVEAMTALPRT